MLFDSNTNNLKVIHGRRLVSTNPRTLGKYIDHIRQAFSANRINERRTQLEEDFGRDGPTEELVAQYNTLDEQCTHIMLAAEERCARRSQCLYAWSPEMEKAGCSVTYWRTRLSQLKTKKSCRRTLDGLANKTGLINEALHSNLLCGTEIVSHLKQAWTDLKNVQAVAQERREVMLLARADLYSTLHNMEAHKAVKAIQLANASRHSFSKLKNIFNRNKAALDKIQIEDTDGNLQWVCSAEEVHQHILQSNFERFRGHQNTPFGNGERMHRLGSDCCSEDFQAILAGEYDYEMADLSDEAIVWLKCLKKREVVQLGGTIDSTITPQDFVSAWGKYRESTASSPSNRHYGHYKAAAVAAKVPPETKDGKVNPLFYPELATHHAAMCNIPVHFGFAPDRWQRSTNLMLEKASGSRVVDKLRIIHLFEADFNFVLKVIFGRRLIHFAEDRQLLGDEQHGCRPGRQANDACLEKKLLYDFSRITRTSLVTVDNDAKACYDRILRALAMIACVSYGLPETTAKMHNAVHDRLVHSVQTAHGRSDNTYQGTTDERLEGTGQGSGASPAIWTIYGITLLTAYAQKAMGMKMFDPSLTLMINIFTIYYVDDGMPGVSNAGVATALTDNELIDQATKDAQSWERLLHVSGGQLELSKCFTYILSYEWKYDGSVKLKRSHEFEKKVVLHSSVDGQATQLENVDPSIGKRTMGIRIAPSGNWKDEFKYRAQQSKELACLLQCGQLGRTSVWLAYTAIICPAMEYPLPITGFTSQQCLAIQQPITTAALQALGYPRTFPRAVAFGPSSAGGIGLHKYEIEQAISHIKTFVGHFRQPGRTKDAIQCLLAFTQRTAGTSRPILEECQTQLDYVDHNWILDVRNSLATTKLRIRFIKNMGPYDKLLRERDGYIMDYIITKGSFTKSELVRINACRLWLRISRVSELVDVKGARMLTQALSGIRDNRTVQPHSWPNQEFPARSSWILWRKALKTTIAYNSVGTSLPASLGNWLLEADTSDWPDLVDTYEEVLYRRRDNNWYRHDKLDLRRSRLSAKFLLGGIPCNQPPMAAVPAIVTRMRGELKAEWRERNTVSIEPLNNIWSHRQSFLDRVSEVDTIGLRKCLADGVDFYAASDGGLKNHKGSFGWVVGAKEAPLKVFAQSNGPATAPTKVQSSTRTELVGMLAALEYIEYSCQENNIEFSGSTCTLWCDNQGAVRIVQRLVKERLQYTTSRTYGNYDIIAQLHKTICGLPCMVQCRWVKGHQKQTGQLLHIQAAMNVLADKLSTEYVNGPSAQTVSPTFPAQELYAVDKNETPILSRLDHSIRHEATLEPLRQFYSIKYKWSLPMWLAIDHDAFATARRKFSSADQRRIVLLRSNWLPVNRRVARYGIDRSPMCPRCHGQEETVDHLLQCPHAKTKLLTHIESELAELSTRATVKKGLGLGISRWLEGTAVSEDEMNNLSESVRQAVYSQDVIGWGNLFCGFISGKWQTAQEGATNEANDAKAGKWAAMFLARILKEVIQTWSERNADLHGNNPEEQESIAKVLWLEKIKRQSAVKSNLREHDQREVFPYDDEKLELMRAKDLETYSKFITKALPGAVRRSIMVPRSQTTLLDHYCRRSVGPG